MLIYTLLQILKHLRLHLLQIVNLAAHIINLARHQIHPRSLLLISHHHLQLFVEILSLLQLFLLLSNQFGLLKVLSYVFVALPMVLMFEIFPHLFVSSPFILKFDHPFVSLLKFASLSLLALLLGHL